MVKHNSKILKQLFLIMFLLNGSHKMYAQNHLYTTEQFGIESAMLGGAVTSGVNDVSMAFYNPGGIHKVSPQLNISFIQPTLRTYGFEKFWNNNESDLNTDIGLKPTLISYKTKIKKFNIAFLKISKSELVDEFSSRQDLIENNRLTNKYFDYEYSGKDTWFGLGSNLKLGSKLYLGLSQFVSISSFSYRNNISLKESSNDQSQQLLRYFDSRFEGTYQYTALITKIGGLYDTDRHDIGITVTTPLYLRLGSGGDLLASSTNTNSNTTEVDQTIEKDITPTIKTPWEVNLGYSFELNDNQKLWLNFSYHPEIAEYTMVNIATQNASIPWINGSKEVFNYSVGYSYKVSSTLQLSGAFRTNQFAYENKLSTDESFRNLILDGNHIHYVIGSKLKFHKNTILFAIDYGTISNIPNEGNFDQIQNINVLSPNLNGLKKNNISFLITYGFILDEIKKLN